jgi:hypothetical protein
MRLCDLMVLPIIKKEHRNQVIHYPRCRLSGEKAREIKKESCRIQIPTEICAYIPLQPYTKDGFCVQIQRHPQDTNTGTSTWIKKSFAPQKSLLGFTKNCENRKNWLIFDTKIKI